MARRLILWDLTTLDGCFRGAISDFMNGVRKVVYSSTLAAAE